MSGAKVGRPAGLSCHAFNDAIFSQNNAINVRICVLAVIHFDLYFNCLLNLLCVWI